MTWLGSYVWHLRQFPAVFAHLRDSMVPISSAAFDRPRVSGSSDPRRLPMAVGSGDLTPMEEGDHLWRMLIWFGSDVAQHLTADDAPGPLRYAWTLDASGEIAVYPGEDWRSLAGMASTITTWLRGKAETVETVTPLRGEAETLFAELRVLVGKYHLNPPQLRVDAAFCVLCGSHAVRASWTVRRDGAAVATVQCAVCHFRYDPDPQVCECGHRLADHTPTRCRAHTIETPCPCTTLHTADRITADKALRAAESAQEAA